MSAVSNIVLNDAQATPVPHTFIPLGPDESGVWWWEDQTGTSAIGYNKISMKLTRSAPAKDGENSGARVNRVKVGIHTPKLETLANNSAGLTPPPQVAYTPRVFIEFVMSERSIVQDRKDLRKFADFLLVEAQLTDMVENLRNVY